MRKRVVICERERANERNYSNTRIHTQNDSCGFVKRPERSKKIDTFRFGGSLTEGAGLTVKRSFFIVFVSDGAACKRWPLAKCWPEFDISSQHVEDLLFSCRSAYWNQLMVFLDLVCLPTNMRNKTEPFSYQTGYSAFPFRSRLSVRRRTGWNEWKLKLSQPETHTKKNSQDTSSVDFNRLEWRFSFPFYCF